MFDRGKGTTRSTCLEGQGNMSERDRDTSERKKDMSGRKRGYV